ncbi:MAG: hypothetical protein GYB67_16695 [Chloroflexi bacterium]|nr:hypothetical protein [Chloroflexota bacterium]
MANVISGGPAERGDLNYGDTVTDSTAGSDRVWRFQGTAGDLIGIDLHSDDFDTYLLLYDSSGQVIEQDDDSGPNLSSLIARFELPASDSYAITARSRGGEPGEYTLSLYRVDPGADPSDAPTPIEYGAIVEGEMTNVTGVGYTFKGVANEVVTIDLQGDFDTYLTLLGTDGDEIASDDDGGTGSNSLISLFTLPENGDYTIIARALEGETGSYRLSLYRDQ